MAVITFTTDFGLKDGNVAIMKGIVLQIAPGSQLVDISHLIQPQNINEAAEIIFSSSLSFPAGTIHVVVVDPGVGTSRRPIAAKIGSQYFICPDNGVLTLILDHAAAHDWHVDCVHLNNKAYWLPEISHVFHGRDIFAPVAGHIAHGVSLDSLGSPILDLTRIQFPLAKKTRDGWQGEIVFIDNFGNIVTNISEQFLEKSGTITVRLNNMEIKGISRTFGEHPTGDLIALIGGTNTLIISVVNGNAAQQIHATVGGLIEVTASDG